MAWTAKCEIWQILVKQSKITDFTIWGRFVDIKIWEMRTDIPSCKFWGGNGSFCEPCFFFVAFSSDFPYFRFDQTNDEYFNLFVHFQNNFPSLKRRVCWFNASLILDGWIHQSKIFYSSSGSRSFPPGSSAFQVHLAQIYAQITETDWTNSITALRFGFQRRSILYLSLISFLPFWKHVTYLGHPKFTNNE